jgi:hypothetical protein
MLCGVPEGTMRGRWGRSNGRLLGKQELTRQVMYYRRRLCIFYSNFDFLAILTSKYIENTPLKPPNRQVNPEIFMGNDSRSIVSLARIAWRSTCPHQIGRTDLYWKLVHRSTTCPKSWKMDERIWMSAFNGATKSVALSSNGMSSIWCFGCGSCVEGHEKWRGWVFAWEAWWRQQKGEVIKGLLCVGLFYVWLGGQPHH